MKIAKYLFIFLISFEAFAQIAPRRFCLISQNLTRIHIFDEDEGFEQDQPGVRLPELMLVIGRAQGLSLGSPYLADAELEETEEILTGQQEDDSALQMDSIEVRDDTDGEVRVIATERNIRLAPLGEFRVVNGDGSFVNADANLGNGLFLGSMRATYALVDSNPMDESFAMIPSQIVHDSALRVADINIEDGAITFYITSHAAYADIEGAGINIEAEAGAGVGVVRRLPAGEVSVLASAQGGYLFSLRGESGRAVSGTLSLRFSPSNP